MSLQHISSNAYLCSIGYNTLWWYGRSELHIFVGLKLKSGYLSVVLRHVYDRHGLCGKMLYVGKWVYFVSSVNTFPAFACAE